MNPETTTSTPIYKNKIVIISIILVLVLAGLYVYYTNGSNKQSTEDYFSFQIVDKSDLLEAKDLINPKTDNLTSNEISGLLQVREEEKLAKDVYQALDDVWRLNILRNVAESESTHTDTVRDLLFEYNIEDPVKTGKRGEFAYTIYNQLYLTLVEKGSKSQREALSVAASIEDLDIYDLTKLRDEATNSNVITVYNNLLKGSRNHIRAFTRSLSDYDVTYKAQYITQSDLDKILSSDREVGLIK